MFVNQSLLTLHALQVGVGYSIRCHAVRSANITYCVVNEEITPCWWHKLIATAKTPFQLKKEKKKINQTCSMTPSVQDRSDSSVAFAEMYRSLWKIYTRVSIDVFLFLTKSYQLLYGFLSWVRYWAIHGSSWILKPYKINCSWAFFFFFFPVICCLF